MNKIMRFIYNIYIYILNFINKIFNIFKISNIYNKCLFIIKFINNKKSKNIKCKSEKSQFNIGLLTNELPPIVYGGVATWIVNFINMFKNDKKYNIVPIFLAYNDKLKKQDSEKYDKLRIINDPTDIKLVFSDIDICVNNLWIHLDTIKEIKRLYKDIDIITVCHSLIQMENITNLGSCYTNNWNDQENTFMNSDYVILISKAEENYYNKFGYDMLGAKTKVIYNSYNPKYDDKNLEINYESNDIGYIGRHVPRKRPELPLRAVCKLNIKNINVYNMGVDYDKYDNMYWRILEKNHKDQLKIIPFTSNKKIIENYWKTIGFNCIVGIYEPFGYTICEALDRRIPLIVSNIDGPSEIIDEVKQYICTYDVDIDDYNNDIDNFSDSLIDALKLSPQQRKDNAEKARKCLDKLRPEIIKQEWIKLFDKCLN